MGPQKPSIFIYPAAEREYISILKMVIVPVTTIALSFIVSIRKCQYDQYTLGLFSCAMAIRLQVRSLSCRLIRIESTDAVVVVFAKTLFPPKARSRLTPCF